MSERKWPNRSSRSPPHSPAEGEWRLFTTSLDLKQLDEAHHLTPEKIWAFQERRDQMLIGAALARAGLADSARRVLLRARADAKIERKRELLRLEAYGRTSLGEQDEAVRLMREYVSLHPEERAVLAKNQAWMFKRLFENPAYRALLGA